MSSENPDWEKLIESLEYEESLGKVLSKEETDLLNELRRIKDDSVNAYVNLNKFNTNKSWVDFLSRVNFEKSSEEIQKDQAVIRKIDRSNLVIKISAAAVIICALLAGIFFYNGKGKGDQPAFVSKNTKEIINPGGNKATLTLGNGTKIDLTAAGVGQVVKIGNVTVVKSEDGQVEYKSASALPSTAVSYNTITTPRGGQYKVVLPDGSEVVLNSMSSLKFPTAFSMNERLVSLTGEGYFEVKRNEKAAFKVNVNGKQVVEVLGTHFNIMAYDDEPLIKTTLLKGRVHISVNKSDAGLILKPGQQALQSTSGELNMKELSDPDQIVAWKNGLTSFSKSDIKSIMRQVARWYDVEVEYRPGIPNRSFSGDISRGSSISSLLKILELNDVHFVVEGKKIIVMP
ncbi:hypothetical protein CPT03_10925 [Pedobacter ginsengisoli]|uniref:Iron dicitrate transport regulator FecR n=1 Tax=Pedobacter ginsengisoli TaxID=363852 RepID=A0A2D1U5U0_9SPHI|nr:FecR family protein [Pedobacter ginsengisoli]ATP56958.1 hypothetical protein CPT03_10925 [Pedobacter ginsengisoli]